MDKNTSSNSKSARCKYKLFYKGKTHELEANSSFEAQEKGKAFFRTKKGWEISVVLMEVEGREVTHSPDF